MTVNAIAAQVMFDRTKFIGKTDNKTEKDETVSMYSKGITDAVS